MLPQTFAGVNLGEVCVDYGRSGHCVGSLWYHIKTAASNVLFSGDYCENSLFTVDKIEGREAGLAVLDCAFGNTPYNRGEQESKIIKFAEEALLNGSLLLPVPKNGRATDLIYLLGGLKCNFFVDFKLRSFFAAQEKNDYWIPKSITEKIESLIYRLENSQLHGVYLIADAQLSTDAGVRTARNILQGGGKILLSLLVVLANNQTHTAVNLCSLTGKRTMGQAKTKSNTKSCL